jgi:hypothetical protein
MKKSYLEPQIEIVDIHVEHGFGASTEGASISVYNQEELGGANGDENAWAN